MNLLELHEKYNSLKSHDKWSYARAYLTDLYPQYFDPVRETATKILEIGIYFGGSICAMRDFFPKAVIVGADLKLHKEVVARDLNRIVLVQIDQREEADLHRLGKMGPYDFIIEDGEHLLHSQKLAMDVLPQYLKPGGVLFIEDVIPRHKGHRIEAYARGYNVPGREVIMHKDLIAVRRTA